MKIKDVKKLKPHERLLYWITERDSIRAKKEMLKEPKPWTDDEILQQYRFCNVRRMDDKVSRWLYDNWYHLNLNHKNMLLAVALARFINLPSSLEVVGFPKIWNPERIKLKLRNWRDSGHTIFNGAYMVRGNDGMDKIECVVDYYVAPLSKILSRVNLTSMQETHAAVLESYGMGSFMAGQIVADLRWAIEGSWADRFDWAPIGPGSKRGINRLFAEHPNNPVSQEEFQGRLEWMMEQCQASLPKAIMDRLEAIDYQNCLCEFDKYSRVLFGEGKPKQRYVGL